LAENWSWARDVIGRDRDETETLTIFLEKTPRRDVGTSRDRDVETETTTLRSGSFKVTEVGTSRKPECYFLVINSNRHSISYRFGVIAA